MKTIRIEVTESELQKIINSLSLSYDKYMEKSKNEGEESMLGSHYKGSALAYEALASKMSETLSLSNQ